ncbi:hypothetical protein ABVT39_025285 [Epinephelus coioides]
MSDSNLDPVPEDFDPGLDTLLEIAATPPSCRRRSTRALSAAVLHWMSQNSCCLSLKIMALFQPQASLSLSYMSWRLKPHATIRHRLHSPLLKHLPLQSGPPLCQLVAAKEPGNLVSLILPSPECDKAIAPGGDITAVFKSTDPRLCRNLSIGQFIAAFSIYRDVIYSVFL